MSKKKMEIKKGGYVNNVCSNLFGNLIENRVLS